MFSFSVVASSAACSVDSKAPLETRPESTQREPPVDEPWPAPPRPPPPCEAKHIDTLRLPFAPVVHTKGPPPPLAGGTIPEGRYVFTGSRFHVIKGRPVAPPEQRRGAIDVHGDVLTMLTESSPGDGMTWAFHYRATNGVLTTTAFCWVFSDGMAMKPWIEETLDWAYSVTPTALVLRSPHWTVKPDENGVVGINDEGAEDQVFVRAPTAFSPRPSTARDDPQSSLGSQ